MTNFPSFRVQHFDVSIAKPDATEPLKLHIPPLDQARQTGTTKWCWALVASAVSKHYDHERGWEPHEFANKIFNRCDCGSTAHSHCHDVRLLEEALKITGNWADTLEKPISEALIREELKENRPIGVRIEWKDTLEDDAHVVLIHGIFLRNGLTYVHVADPDDHDIEHPLSRLFGQYGASYGGSWTRTYLTKPREGEEVEFFPCP